MLRSRSLAGFGVETTEALPGPPDGAASPERAGIPVSAIVMTKNEERDLPACLRSLGRFAEVFVVDSASTDATCEIAARSGAHVVPFSWNGEYPKKKQWCLENLPFSFDWVLYVDADEQVTPQLAAEIERILEVGPRHAGYFARLDYVFLGRVLRHGHQNVKLILFDRRRGRFMPFDDLDAQESGEVELHFQPRIEGPVGSLAAPIIHADHGSLYQYFDRHNRYSDWEAVVRLRGQLGTDNESQLPARRALKRAFRHLPGKPLMAFAHSYVAKRGFLDGRPGLDFAVARAFYYWQVGIKLRELRRQNVRA